MEWRPIESAPKDGTDILAFDPNWRNQASVMAWVLGEWIAVDDCEGYLGSDLSPTHWMPLPEPPKE